MGQCGHPQNHEPRRWAIAILQLIDQLTETLNRGQRIPFTAYRIVHADELAQLLERLRISVPSSIRESERTLAERDRILADARAEATRLVEEAKQQAMEIVSQETLVVTARQEADRIVAEGKRLSRQRAEEADRYAVDVLRELAQRLQGIAQQVNNGIEVMGGTGAAKPAAPQAQRPAGDPPQ